MSLQNEGKRVSYSQKSSCAVLLIIFTRPPGIPASLCS